MSAYIVICDEEVASWIGNDVDSMKSIICCRDCKYYGYGKYATHCYRFVHKVAPDGYCAWGERRGA